MKKTHRTEGIILQKFAFQDYDEIITVFSQDFGMMKLMVRGARKTNKGREGTTAPLMLAEFVFSQGKGDLWTSWEIHPLHPHHPLRTRLDSLQAAGTCVQTLLRTQGLHQATPALYALLKAFLKKLSTAAHPPALAASFLLKTLKHDGLLAEERFLTWTPDEAALARFLANCTSLQELADTPVPPHFVQHVETLL